MRAPYARPSKAPRGADRDRPGDWLTATGGPVQPFRGGAGVQRQPDRFVQGPDAGDTRDASRFAGDRRTYQEARDHTGRYVPRPLADGAHGPDETGGGTTSRAAEQPRRHGQGFGDEAVNGVTR